MRSDIHRQVHCILNITNTPYLKLPPSNKGQIYCFTFKNLLLVHITYKQKRVGCVLQEVRRNTTVWRHIPECSNELEQEMLNRPKDTTKQKYSTQKPYNILMLSKQEKRK